MRTLICLLALTSVTSSVFAADAEDVADQLAQRWYETEIIVFERTGIADQHHGEVLDRDEPRAYPARLMSLLDGSEHPWALDPETASEAARFRMGRGVDLRPAKRRPKRRSAPVPEPVEPEADEAEDEPPTDKELFLEALNNFEATLPGRALVPLDNFALLEQAKRLTRGNRHRILWHKRWLEALPQRGRSRPVLVQTGPLSDGIFELEGSLGVSVGRYLHLDAELWLHEPAVMIEPVPQSEAQDGPPVEDLSAQLDVELPPFMAESLRYRALKERRRLKSDELHYLDHPRFGMLVIIQPTAIPEELVAQLTALEED